MQNKIT